MINFVNSYRRYVLDLEQINYAALSSPGQFIENIEKSFKKEISGAANYILNSSNNCRVVMLSGPSSSGKTTTANMISKELAKLGVQSTVISLDDFYLGHEDLKTSIEDDNKYDYETITALDINQIKECIASLLEKGCCEKPTYNFETMKPEDFKTPINLNENGIAIIEGIHALNPIFTEHINSTGIIKIYVNVKQGIKKSNNEKVMTNRDIRLIRRIIRDFKFRETSAHRTINMWQRVCDGEDKYISPFRNLSHLTINSIHMYELCIFAPILSELLSEAHDDPSIYETSQRLINLVKHFHPIDKKLVPKDSLMKEFF